MSEEKTIRAQDIMSRQPVTVGPKASIQDIVKLLIENDISGIPVVDDEDRLLGIISESDLLHKEVVPTIPDAINILGAIIYYNGVKEYRESFRKMMASTAEEIMTKKVISVNEEADLSEIGQRMIEHHIKRLPVLREGVLVGIISRTDMIRLLLE